MTTLPKRFSQVRHTLDIIRRKLLGEIIPILFKEEAKIDLEIVIGLIAKFRNRG